MKIFVNDIPQNMFNDSILENILDMSSLQTVNQCSTDSPFQNLFEINNGGNCMNYFKIFIILILIYLIYVSCFNNSQDESKKRK